MSFCRLLIVVSVIIMITLLDIHNFTDYGTFSPLCIEWINNLYIITMTIKILV